jgi:predicted MFS family arabinose efflux permease
MTSRRLLIALFPIAALANINGMALYPLLTSIAEEFGLSVSAIAQAGTAALIGGAVIGLVVGPLADHFGRRRFVILGALLMAASNAATSLATGFEALLLARFAAGIATGIMLGIGLSLATTLLTGDERRAAVGWIVTATASGAVVGPATMAMLAEAFSWRAGFWVLSLAPVLAAAGCYRIITPDPTVPESPFRLHAALSG